jgi:phosphoribosylaminoimidazolecarboxamide formyltransferase / IMP cyclohydrolase
LSGYALLSVYDKSGLDRLAASLSKHGIAIIASGGTAETLRKLGYSVKEVSDHTGMPEMPGGLVKTLHPKIHAGILGDWNDPDQRKYLTENSVEPFDFVVVNLYPFHKVVGARSSDIKKAVDNIDIGGVALIRAAAKGALLNGRVVPITSPAQYEQVIRDLDRHDGISSTLRRKLVVEAFTLTAQYDSIIRDYFRANEN